MLDRPLLVLARAGVNIWATNVVIFALWFWSLDRGGPATRGIISEAKSDFLFTQQQAGVVQGEQFEEHKDA